MKAPNPRPNVTRGLPRLLRVAAVVLFSLYSTYLLTANIALSHGLIYDPVNRATPQLKMKWESAYTLWPGRVTLSGFTMRFDDDHMVQLDVKAEKSTANISFTSLFQRRIRFTRVRASGVSYRMSVKVDAATAKASPERVAAFPVVPGFPSPPVPKTSTGCGRCRSTTASRT